MSAMSIVLLCILGLLIIAFVISTIDAVIAFYSPVAGQNDPLGEPGVPHLAELARKMKEQIKKVLLINYETCRTESYDGLELCAKYYHVKDGAPYILLMHGYRGVAERDFAFILPILLKNGYNVIMPDERATGKSKGHAVTFGIKERKDVRTWLYYMLNRFGNIDICLYGISMGAASVLMASELNLPHNVKCIVADCPYSAPRDIIQKVCTKVKLPPKLSYALLKLSAFLYCKMNIDGASAKDAVKHTDVPILMFHGEEDWFVPCEMSKEIQDACYGYVERYTFPGADHAFSSVVDPDRYERLLNDFLDRFLQSEKDEKIAVTND